MSTLIYSDLDQQPQCAAPILALYQAASRGRRHAVCGEPARMGCEPRAKDLAAAVGVLVALQNDTLHGAMALCPYSQQQLTIWGPVTISNANPDVASGLLQQAKASLKKTDLESLRTLVDHRNRDLRTFFLNNGLTPWKDNICFSRKLDGAYHSYPSALRVETAKPQDHAQIKHLLRLAFPDSGHYERPLSYREEQGYTHYVLKDAEHIIGTAVTKRAYQRTWMSMITITEEQRGHGHAQHLIHGICSAEFTAGMKEIALEVLADNAPACHAYIRNGFQKSFTATIMTGPL